MEETLPLRRSTRHSVVAKTEELTPRKRNAATPVKVEPNTPSRRTRASSTTPKKSLFESVTTPKKTLPVLNEEETPKKKKTTKAISKIKDKEGSPKKSDLTRTPKKNVNVSTTHVGVKEDISTPKKVNLGDGQKVLVESSEEIHVAGDRPMTRAKRKTMAVNPVIEINTKSLEIEKKQDNKEGNQIDKSVNIVETTNNYVDNKSNLKRGVESCLALVPKILITDFTKQILKEANIADNGKEIDHDIFDGCESFVSKSPLKAEDIPIKSPKKASDNSKSTSEASLVVNNSVTERSIDMSEDTSSSPKKTADYKTKKSLNSDGKSPVKFDPFSSKSPINRNSFSVTSSKKVTGIEGLVGSRCVVNLEKVSCTNPPKMHTVDSFPNSEEAALQLEANNTISGSEDKDTKESLTCDPSTIGTFVINGSGMMSKIECREQQSESKGKSSSNEEIVENVTLMSFNKSGISSDVEAPTEILKNFENVSESSQVNVSADKKSPTKLENDNHSEIEMKELKLAEIANESCSKQLKDILNSNNPDCLENVSVTAEEIEKSSETIHVAETLNSENVFKTISFEIVTDMKNPKTTENPNFDNQNCVGASGLVLSTVVNDISSSESNNISSSATELGLENESLSTETASKGSEDLVLQIAPDICENLENIPKNMGIMEKETHIKANSNNSHLNKIIVSDSMSTANSDQGSSTLLSDVLCPNKEITMENDGSNLSDLDEKSVVTIQASADDLNVSKTLPIKIVTDEENNSKSETNDSGTKSKIEADGEQNITEPDVSTSTSKETDEAVITEMVENATSNKIGLNTLPNSLNTISAISKNPHEVENIIHSNDELNDTELIECKCICNSDSKCIRCITAQGMKKDFSEISRDVSKSLVNVAETDCDTNMISSKLTCETKENDNSLVNKENACEKVELKTVILKETSESIVEFQNVMTEIKSSSEVNGVSVLNSEYSTENISKLEGISIDETNKFDPKIHSNNIINEDLNLKGATKIVEDISIKTCKPDGVEHGTVEISSVTKDLEATSCVCTAVEMRSSNETHEFTSKGDGLDIFLMSPKDFLKSDEESLMDEVPPEKLKLKKSKVDAHLHSETNGSTQQNSENIDNEVMIMNNNKDMKVSSKNVEAIEHNSSEICDNEQVNFTVIDNEGTSSVPSINNYCLEVTDKQQLTSSDGDSSGGLIDEIVTSTNMNDKITNDKYDKISNVSSSPVKESFQNKGAEDVCSHENSSFNSSSVVGSNEMKLSTVDIVSESEQFETNCNNGNNESLSMVSEHKEIHDNELKTLNAETILKEEISLIQSSNVVSENEGDSKLKAGSEIKLQTKQCEIEKYSPGSSRIKEGSELDVSNSLKDEFDNNGIINEEKTSGTRLKKPKYKRIVSKDSSSDDDESIIVGKKKRTSNKSVNKKGKISFENSGSETCDSVEDHYPPANDCGTENKCPEDNQISAKDFIDFEAAVGEEWSDDNSVSEEVSSSSSSSSVSSDLINFEAKESKKKRGFEANESKKKRSLEIDSSDDSDYIDSFKLLFPSPPVSFSKKNKKTKLEKVNIENEEKCRISNRKHKKINKEVVDSLMDSESLKITKTGNKLTKEFTKTGVFVISSVSPDLQKTKLPKNPTSTKSSKSLKRYVKKIEFSNKGFSVSPQTDNTCRGFVVTQIKSNSEPKKSTEKGTIQSGLLNQKNTSNEKSSIKNSNKKSVKKSLNRKDSEQKPKSFVATFVLPFKSTSKTLEEVLKAEGITYISIKFVQPTIALVEFSNEESFKNVLGLYGKIKLDNQPIYILE